MVTILGAVPSYARIVIVDANFNNSDLQSAGNVTEANLDLGTPGGTWTIGNVEDSLINDSTTDPNDHALAGDRGPYDFTLDITGSDPLLATDEVEVSLDWEIIRTLSGTADEKENFFVGFDSLGNEVFRLILTLDGGTDGDRGRLGYIDTLGMQVNVVDDLPSVDSNPGQFVIADLTDVQLDLGTATFDILVNGSTEATNIPYRTLGVFDLASLQLLGSGPGDDDGTDAGAWYDNIEVSVVPEPSSIALGVIAMLCLGLAARRRSQ